MSVFDSIASSLSLLLAVLNIIFLSEITRTICHSIHFDFFPTLHTSIFSRIDSKISYQNFIYPHISSNVILGKTKSKKLEVKTSFLFLPLAIFWLVRRQKEKEPKRILLPSVRIRALEQSNTRKTFSSSLEFRWIFRKKIFFSIQLKVWYCYVWVAIFLLSDSLLQFFFLVLQLTHLPSERKWEEEHLLDL